jgi:hypothetical protein
MIVIIELEGFYDIERRPGLPILRDENSAIQTCSSFYWHYRKNGKEERKTVSKTGYKYGWRLILYQIYKV